MHQFVGQGGTQCEQTPVIPLTAVLEDTRVDWASACVVDLLTEWFSR